MHLIDLLGTAGRLAFLVLQVVGPLLIWQWIVVACRPWRGVSNFVDATVLSGAMIGAAAVPLVVPSAAIGWTEVVTPGGPWDLSLSDFLERAFAFMALAVPSLLDGLQSDDPHHDLRIWVLLSVVIWMCRIAVATTLGRGISPIRFMVAEIVTIVSSLYGTVYLAPLLLWSINQLNFWLLLILVMLIQDYRHNEPPALSRIFGMLSGMARLHRHGVKAAD